MRAGKETIKRILGWIVLAGLCIPAAVVHAQGTTNALSSVHIPADAPYLDHAVSGVSPNGTTIDLFDYWITEQTHSDASDPAPIDAGINDAHALLFSRSPGSRKDAWNQWTGDRNPYEGIVHNTLGGDGYPVLNNLQSQEVADAPGTESLAYLFDPDMQVSGKKSFSDIQGLLQVDGDGYYYYNSRQNYAAFYAQSNAFVLYAYPGVVSGGASGAVGQFFPFNAATADAQSIYYTPPGSQTGSWHTLMNASRSTDEALNHYFGLHMSTRFVQQYGGYTTQEQQTAVTYEFSGDDDAWIFIDGVLVADLGGIHDAASVRIDFSTGEIWLNGERQEKTLGQLLGYGGATLPDDSYHTLDFFYLERGNTDSNLYLKYNLVTIPESNLIKIDQIGDPVPGAEFTLYAAGDTARENPIAQGVTDEDGTFLFLDEEGFPITIQRLFEQYGDAGTGSDLVLVETDVPAGYRACGEIGLSFYRTAAGEVLLLSDSAWDHGAYAMAKVTATAPNVIRAAENPDTKVTLSGSGAVDAPVMFAVVFQKQESGEWYPVYGDPLQGWTVMPDGAWNSILTAAKESTYLFTLASSGAYQVEIGNLPGDIRSYYHICMDEDAAQYTVGYYYTSASSLDDATQENTWRIDADPPSDAAQYALQRVFSMDLYVTNLKNRLFVQKVDELGNPVAGAAFDLYRAQDVTVRADGTAVIRDGAQPCDSLITTQTTQIPGLSGGGVFPTDGHVLENGAYYLIEAQAPAGYRKNETAVHVVIDDTGIYADAGQAGDGVSVLCGVGSVMRSMVQFAVDDGVDVTLHDIRAAAASNVTCRDGVMHWQDADWDRDVLHLQYANAASLLDYGLYEHTDAATIDELTIAAQQGWSKLLVAQCYRHDDSVDTSLKTDLAQLGYTDITALFSGTVTVRVANHRTGSLRVEKTVAGTAGERDRSWDFTVTLSGQTAGGLEASAVSGTYGDMTFDAGTAHVLLKHGEHSTATNLPAGLSYTVTETQADRDGYETAAAGQEGTIPHAEEAVASFTNTKDLPLGALTVEKTVEGTAGERDRSWDFTVTLSGRTAEGIDASAVSGTYGDMTFEAGVAHVSLKHGEHSTATNLPAGLSYTVTETQADRDGYETAAAGQEGTIPHDGEAVASFTNTKDLPLGALTVEKTVEGTAGERDRSWDFTVTLLGRTAEGIDASTVSGTYGDMTFDAGVAHVLLKHGEHSTATNLPAGLSYMVTEEQANADDYITTASGDTGTIPAEGQATASFTNTKDLPQGALTVTKTVEGTTLASDFVWDFTLTLQGDGADAVNGTYGELSFEHGVARFTLQDGQSRTATDLPAGLSYTVTEKQANRNGWVTTATEETGTIAGDDTVQVSFVNDWTGDPNAPQTGDGNGIRLWARVCLLSLTCLLLIIGLRYGRKRVVRP
jgi:fibro-slime domain-containing protein